MLELNTNVSINENSVVYINKVNDNYVVRFADGSTVNVTQEVYEQLKEYEGGGSSGGGAVVIDVGSAQETFDEKVFPRIPLATAQQIYNEYTSGKVVILRWSPYGIPVEATVLGSDYIGGKYAFDVVIHDMYNVEYSYTDETTDYATMTATKLGGSGGGELYIHYIDGNLGSINSNSECHIYVYTNTATAFTRTTFWNWFWGTIGQAYNKLPAWGSYQGYPIVFVMTDQAYGVGKVGIGYLTGDGTKTDARGIDFKFGSDRVGKVL